MQNEIDEKNVKKTTCIHSTQTFRFKYHQVKIMMKTRAKCDSYRCIAYVFCRQRGRDDPIIGVYGEQRRKKKSKISVYDNHIRRSTYLSDFSCLSVRFAITSTRLSVTSLNISFCKLFFDFISVKAKHCIPIIRNKVCPMSCVTNNCLHIDQWHATKFKNLMFTLIFIISSSL